MHLLDVAKEVATEPKKFLDLPRPAQKALIQYYGLESSDRYAETLEHSQLMRIVSCQEDGQDVDANTLEAAWDDAIALVAEVDDGRYGCAEIATNTFCSALFAMNEEIQEDHPTFTDYHRWYTSKETPSYSEINRYPVVLGCPVEGIVDGWHRFHSYVKCNHKSIPFLFHYK